MRTKTRKKRKKGKKGKEKTETNQEKKEKQKGKGPQWGTSRDGSKKCSFEQILQEIVKQLCSKNKTLDPQGRTPSSGVLLVFLLSVEILPALAFTNQVTWVHLYKNDTPL